MIRKIINIENLQELMAEQKYLQVSVMDSSLKMQEL